MRSSRVLIILFLLSVSNILPAQKHYWIFFTDKEGVDFNPYSYFSSKAIEKKLARGESLYGFTDLPLRRDYVSAVEKITGHKVTESRWFNAVAVQATSRELSALTGLRFVRSTSEIVHGMEYSSKPFNESLTYGQSYLLRLQLAVMGRKYFEDRKIDGAGIRIAVFDGGFPGVDTSPVFKHLRDNKRIIATYDFVKRDSFVYDYSSHGTSTLTCITGMLGDQKFGLATGSEFLLARTEVSPRERISEEENWVAAVEWAFQHGADIISSSLGYTYHRYFPWQMDGKSTMISRAANMAATMGMLVVNAAGNDGDKSWEVIGAPADADSVLSVGGVSPGRGWHRGFSSYGPTYDGRMKPNVCAFAEVVTTNQKRKTTSFGTSFACPLVSGFAACVMQMNPDWPNMRVFREIEKSGHLYPYYDYAHGYGIPQASYFITGTIIPHPTFSMKKEGEKIMIATGGKPVSALVPEKKDLICCDELYDLDKDYLYFKIAYDPDTVINRYGIAKMKDGNTFDLPLDSARTGSVSIFYRGYSETLNF